MQHTADFDRIGTLKERSVFSATTTHASMFDMPAVSWNQSFRSRCMTGCRHWVRRIAPHVSILMATAGLYAPARPLSAQVNAGQANAVSVLSPMHTDGASAPRGSVEKERSEPPNAPSPGNPASLSTAEEGTISGTVQDTNGDLVPGASVVLRDASSEDRREVTADDSALFQFKALKPGASYQVSITRDGFEPWASAPVLITPSQFVYLKDIHLKIKAETSTVTVYASTEQIAVEQVRLEEQQRVLGFIPNFYVVYDSQTAAPLTPKLKFRLAMKVATDPVTVLGIAFMAGVHQAANDPDYVLGAKGYGQRFGATAADGMSDILIGGAILPSLLHQDPRYFYQGSGTTRSRLRHALSAPFICRGDNGRLQPNYSSLGGDLASSAIAMSYYPDSNRGTGQVFGTFAIGTAERMLSAVAQEFIIPRFTSRGHGRHDASR